MTAQLGLRSCYPAFKTLYFKHSAAILNRISSHLKKTRVTSQQGSNFKIATDNFKMAKILMMKRMSIMMNLRERIRGALQRFPGVNAENVHLWKKQLSLFVAMTSLWNMTSMTIY